MQAKRNLLSELGQWKFRQQSRQAILVELKECKTLERGKHVHSEATRSGNDTCIYVATALIKMYAKCRSMVDARQVFESIKNPDVVSWNALILGYAENGHGELSLDLFTRMRFQGCVPNSRTYVAALKACTALTLHNDRVGMSKCKEHGKKLHSECGCHLNSYVQNTLIDMYAKCGSMVDAHEVFETIKRPDVVAWNTLILGYAENGQPDNSLGVYTNMKSQGFAPNFITFLAALKACSFLAIQGRKEECRERGKQIHSEIGCHETITVQNCLIDMYSNCGSMVHARHVFDGMKRPNIVSWNALIMGYAENGEAAVALELFSTLRTHGYEANSRTFVAALQACTSLAQRQDERGKIDCLQRGKQIHYEVGPYLNTCVQNALIDMYAKCGSMVDARNVFVCCKHNDVVSWTTLILGYADNGESATALDVYARMRSQGYAPNSITIVAVLKASGMLGALESGMKVHSEMDTGVEYNVILVTCLVDFYAKCGNMTEALHVFEMHPSSRDVRTWTALLAGYSRLGDANAAFALFDRMQTAGVEPDDVSFLCILACCSHAGLVAKANEYFQAMLTKYRIAATVEHYTCMVDILARSNNLDEGMTMLRGMPCRPNTITWMSVLGACRKWKNVGIGKLAFKSVVTLDNTKAVAFVVMAHLYGSRGMWNEQELVLGMSKMLRAYKEPEQSCWTNTNGEVHMFVSDCRNFFSGS